jgi:GDP/UDP-N,N'-diacetylbacillosamine 2-epimerase (hydrolysing)
MSRKICVVTGTRAEYGLLRCVMEGVRHSPALQLQLVATGAHLSPEFGLTYREIEADGFPIDAKVEMLMSSDTSVGLAKSMGIGLASFGEALDRLRPDMMLVLGDRFEVFAAAAAATVARVPIAHLHGGETSEGAYDEAFRHSVTKMAHLHFVAAEEYRKRVVQLGEDPERVFLVGGLGVDALKKLELLDRPELERALGFELGKRNLLVTFHPATLENGVAVAQMTELLAALDELDDTHLVLTMPNADTESRSLFELLSRFVAAHANARVYTSLGQLRYLSCLRHVDAVVGNSSSGLTEAPSFGKGTINIGDRQRGRLKAASVIDCAPARAAIRAALQRLYSPAFQASLTSARNPYGEGGASDKIVDVLQRHSLREILKKPFYDLPSNDAGGAR